jgi:hypothetical protein
LNWARLRFRPSRLGLGLRPASSPPPLLSGLGLPVSSAPPVPLPHRHAGQTPSSSSSGRSATKPPPPAGLLPLPVTDALPCLLSPLRLPTSLTPSCPKWPAIKPPPIPLRRPVHELPPPPYKSHREHPRTAPPLLTPSLASLLARVSLSPAH